MAQEVASVFARVGADLSDFHRGMGVFTNVINGAGGKFRDFTTGIVQGIGQAFGQASLRALREFGDVVAGVIGAAADMEQSVANIAATMGLTAEQTAKVSALVSELGIDPKLKVTATEAAAAIDMLGKNGVKLDDIMKGAARSTVLLANSTGADFTTSADVATSAMAQFKIQAENMTGAVDQIVGVTRNSKFDINDYRLAISQAGGVAASVGVEFTDFNATLAAIAPSFSGGSSAGTSFKVFLQRLVPDTAPAAEAMKQLGILTEDGGNKFFTASGQMRSMSEIAGVLQQAFGGLSEAQKIQAATNIFGTDAMVAAFALADAGAGTIDKLKTTIGNVSAEESAAIRMNTLKGAWEIFTGIVESLSIKFGTAFLPALRDVVAALTDLAGRVGPQLEVWGAQLGERLKLVAGAAIDLLNVGLGEGLLAIFAPAEDGTRALDKLWVSFGLTSEQAKDLSDRLIGTAGVIRDVAATVGGLIATIGGVVGPILTWIDKTIGLENALRGVALVMAGGFVASIVSTVATIVGAIGTVASFVAGLTGLGTVATTIGGVVSAAIALMGGPITLLIAAVGALALAWRNNWFDIQGKTETAWEAIKGFFANGWDYLKSVSASGWAGITGFFASGWAGITDGVTRAWAGISDQFNSGWNATTASTIIGAAAISGPLGVLAASMGALAVAWRDNWFDIQSKTQTALDAIQRATATAWTTIGSATTSAWDVIKSAAASAWESITGSFAGGWEILKRLTGDGATAIKSFFAGWAAVGEAMMRGLVDGIKAGWQWVTDAAKSVAQSAFDAAKAALGISSPSKEFERLGSYSMDGFARGLGQSAGPLAALRATLAAVQNDGAAYTAGTLAGQLSNAAGRAMGEVGSGCSAAAPGITASLAQILGNVGGAVGDLARRFGSGADSAAQDLMLGLVTGINQRMRWLTDVAGDLARAVLDPIKRALGIASPSRVFRELGQNVTQGFAEGIGAGLQLPEVAINRMVRHTVEAVPAGVPGGVSASSSRIDVYLHGDSALPADRAKLRELARALQQEFVFAGARVAVA